MINKLWNIGFCSLAFPPFICPHMYLLHHVLDLIPYCVFHCFILFLTLDMFPSPVSCTFCLRLIELTTFCFTGSSSLVVSISSTSLKLKSSPSLSLTTSTCLHFWKTVERCCEFWSMASSSMSSNVLASVRRCFTISSFWICPLIAFAFTSRSASTSWWLHCVTFFVLGWTLCPTGLEVGLEGEQQPLSRYHQPCVVYMAPEVHLRHWSLNTWVLADSQLHWLA